MQRANSTLSKKKLNASIPGWPVLKKAKSSPKDVRTIKPNIISVQKGAMANYIMFFMAIKHAPMVAITKGRTVKASRSAV